MNELVWLGLTGLATGLLARALLRGGKFGIPGDAMVAVLGAILGILLFRLPLDEAGGFWALALVALGSAALLVLELRLVQRSTAERFVPQADLGRRRQACRYVSLAPRQPGAGAGPCSSGGRKQAEGTVLGMTQCSRRNLYRSF